jgi:hypothetical protein
MKDESLGSRVFSRGIGNIPAPKSKVGVKNLKRHFSFLSNVRDVSRGKKNDLHCPPQPFEDRWSLP